MRDYLYCFFDPQDASLCVSGITFQTIYNSLLADKTVVLLRHDYSEGRYDPQNHLEYLLPEDLPQLLQEDIHSYGDFCCFSCTDLATINSTGVLAELLYFAHMGRFENARPPLPKETFYWSHDDGWFARIYAEPELLRMTLTRLCRERFGSFDNTGFAEKLEVDKAEAVWVDADGIRSLPQSMDIDQVITANKKR